MFQRLHVLVALFFGAAPFSLAGPITYDVMINTSSITGTTGSFDFNFNPGPFTSQSASLQILDFISDGTLASCTANVQGFCPTGDVGGQLPATVTFDNGTAFNDYFDAFTFGTEMSFGVSLYGPALTSPGAATSGSTFAFSMFSDPAGTIPVLTNDTIDGFAFTVAVNLNGSTTVTNYSSETIIATASQVPEPSTILLIGGAVILVMARLKLKRLVV